MTAPRMEIDLEKIRKNTRFLVRHLRLRGIGVTGVTKGVGGNPAIAEAMLAGGATGLAESRITNVANLRSAGITCAISMIRTPMLSQVDQIVQSCDTSYNTEIDVISGLASAARRRDKVHNIMLMVEMGDMREGIMPENLNSVALQVLKLPNVALRGIGANFACLSSVVPDAATLAKLSMLAEEVEEVSGLNLVTVSGGNSANLPWALGSRQTGRINNLRLGEAILLGVDPVSGTPIAGLYTDAFTLIAEVIETKVKPQPASLHFVDPTLRPIHIAPDHDHCGRSILAIGQQDTDVAGLTMPEGVTYLGATSDHLVIQTTHSHLRVGNELKVQPNYRALTRAMNAPDIAKVLLGETHSSKAKPERSSGFCMEGV